MRCVLALAVVLLVASDAMAGGRLRFRSQQTMTFPQTVSISEFTSVSTSAPAPAPVIIELHTYANEARTRAGLHVFTLDDSLTNAAQRWASYMAATGRFGHGGGEQVIASGQQSASETIADWMRSPGHRAWVLGGSDRAGWGFATGTNGVTYWAGAFGGGQVVTGSFSSTESFSGCANGTCGTTTITSRFRFRSR